MSAAEKKVILAGRSVEELNRGITPEENARHRLRGPFGYEWWYFDAIFDNGYSMMANIWAVNNFKPWTRQCVVMLSIYAPDGGDHIRHRVYPPRRLLRASYDRCDVRLGDNYMRGAYPHFEIRIEIGEEMAHLVFESGAPGWDAKRFISNLATSPGRKLGWLIPAPGARVHGTLRVRGREMEVEGHGYHDHNYGEDPIFFLLDNWHTGHSVSGDLGIKWADMTCNKSLGYEHISLFFLSKGNRIVYESADIKVSYHDWRENLAYLHPYPGRIIVSFGSEGEEARGELTMSVRGVLEAQELLEFIGLPPSLRSSIYRFLAKPYYFKWRSDIDGWVELGGKRLSLQGETTHEQMILRGRRLRGISQGT